MSTDTKTRRVRVELMDGEEARAIVAVIENRGVDVEVEQQLGLVIVRASGRIEIDRDEVELELGRDFNLRDIQGILPAYVGVWTDTSPNRWVLEWN